MATVNKNFRIKNGLVVEGSVATVNGQNILTEGGSDSYIVNLIGGQATSANTPNAVVKRDGSGNFSAGTITANLSGNVTGDVTGTVSSLSNHDTDDLAEGSNLYFTNQRALDATAAAYDAAGAASTAQTNAQNYADSLASNYDAAGAASTAQTNAQNYADSLASNYDAAGAASTAQTNAQNYANNLVNGLDTDDIEEGSSNLYFTNGRARNAVSGGTGITYNSADGIINVAANTYDAYGAASAAEGNANTYTDNQINDLTTDDIEEGSSNKYFTDERAQDAVGNAVGNGLSYDDASGAISVDTSVISTKAYVDQEVAALVDSAPALLDTLNELAAAIGDDANFVTTVTTGLSGKVAKAGDTMTGALTLNADPVNALHAATKQYVDTAETDAVTSANSYTDAEVLKLVDGTTDFEHVDVNAVSRQIAGTTGNIVTAAATTVVQWHKNDYRSAKILVKAKNGTHTHLSELVLTLDTSDNIALNEYAITTTNGSLMTVDADINNSNVRLRVTPANNNTEVMAHATLLV